MNEFAQSDKLEHFILNEFGIVVGIKRYNNEQKMWVHIYFSEDLNEALQEDIVQQLKQSYLEMILKTTEQIKLTLE